MRLSILLLLSAAGIFSNAQTWCAPGSQWHYGWENVSGPTNGYIHLQYTGDTLIGLQSCNKITKTNYWYNQAFQNSGAAYLGTEYTYADSNKVYIYKYNQFYTLYDFSASPGAVWTVPATTNYSGCQTQAVVRVDSVGTTTINSIALRYVCVTFNDTAQHWGWCAKICEKIGPVKTYNYSGSGPEWDYLFPVKNDYCGLVMDGIAEGGNLRCYSDSSGFSYGTGTPCTFLTSASELNKTKITVAPNPAAGIIQIKNLPQNAEKIEVMDITGKIIVSAAPTETIDLSEIDAGIYNIIIKAKRQALTSETIIISR